jgi:hypothetical protein
MHIPFFIFLAAASSSLAGESPVQLCQNPLLTRYEQTLCRDQMTGANDVAERRAAEKKFRDRIKAAEDAQKKKK